MLLEARSSQWAAHTLLSPIGLGNSHPTRQLTVGTTVIWVAPHDRFWPSYSASQLALNTLTAPSLQAL